jgi:hypothetical protein
MWGPGAAGGFQNALSMGLQMGQMANQQRQQNALMQQREAMIANQTRDQQMQEARFAQQQQQEAQTADLTAKALQGDEEALTQLATVSFDRWKSLDGQIKGKAAEDAQVLGNAAIDLLNVPFAERPGRIIAYAQQFPQFAEKINQVAYLPQGEQEAALRTVVAEAKMIDKLIQMERPSYQVLPQGADLVNTRDPQAVAQFAPGGGAPAGFAEGQTATNPQTGQRIVFRNGAWRPM